MRIIILGLSLISSMAFADSGTCKGKTDSGKSLSVFYYANTWTDDNIDYYADITVERNIPATYWLAPEHEGFRGEVTKRSLRNDHLDFGSATFQISTDHKTLKGTLGSETIKTLKCTYSSAQP